MCMLFEICEKKPFQKCMGWGGGTFFSTTAAKLARKHALHISHTIIPKKEAGSQTMPEGSSKQHRHRPKGTKISYMSSVQHADPGCSK